MSKTVTSVIAVLVALLLVSSSLGVFYYYQSGQETESKNQYINELSVANNNYNQLVTNYNSALSLYNETFALLSRVVGVVNTSTPAYQQASRELSQLWSFYLKLKPTTGSLFKANVLIDFGNGTRRWYNDTSVQPGWNLYTLTVILSNGNLQATWYPQYQEHFISGIDGISNSKSTYWYLWTYNKTASWKTAQVGADDLPVYNGSIFAWTFCRSNPDYTPACNFVNGAP